MPAGLAVGNGLAKRGVMWEVSSVQVLGCVRS